MSLHFIHGLHDHLKGPRKRNGVRAHSTAEKTKHYPRMRRVSLPAPAALSAPLERALKERLSSRTFVPGTQFPLLDLSTILYHALAVRTDGHRTHPSGGACFPLEAYIVARTVETLQMGIYHYVPSVHALEHLWDMPHETHIFSGIPLSEWAEHVPAVLVFTSMWNRSAKTYGDFAYMLSLIEVGHAAQNVLLAATARGAKSCPLSGFNKDEVEKLLDLDTQQESAIYTIALSTDPTPQL